VLISTRPADMGSGSSCGMGYDDGMGFGSGNGNGNGAENRRIGFGFGEGLSVVTHNSMRAMRYEFREDPQGCEIHEIWDKGIHT
jgi:hypothetical protein